LKERDEKTPLAKAKYLSPYFRIQSRIQCDRFKSSQSWRVDTMSSNLDSPRQLGDTTSAISCISPFPQSLLNELHGSVCLLDHAGMIVAVNLAWPHFGLPGDLPEAHSTVTDYLALLLSGQVSDPQASAVFVAGIRAVLAGKRSIYSIGLPFLSPGGKRWFTCKVTLCSFDQKPFALVSHVRVDETPGHEAVRRDHKNHWKSFFEDAAIPVWVEDLSEIQSFFSHLRLRGVLDFQKYFTDHPEAVRRCMSGVKIRDANQACLRFLS